MNLINEDNPLPILRGTAKDHKIEADPIKGPDMRPIMGAKVGPNTGLSQIGCKLIRAIKEKQTNIKEIKSTEELCQKYCQPQPQIQPLYIHAPGQVLKS